MRTDASAHAVLVSLLRLGERSAEFAFQRLSRSPAIADTDPYRALLAQIAQDERRHDRALGTLAVPNARLHMSGSAKRFFLGLRDRDIRVHLARIAALDGCVCQIITQVLFCGLLSPRDIDLRFTLADIRNDEGRHVRIARRAALRYGASDGLLQDMDQETRLAFRGVLEPYAESFESMGINPQRLLNRLHRGAP